MRIVYHRYRQGSANDLNLIFSYTTGLKSPSTTTVPLPLLGHLTLTGVGGSQLEEREGFAG